MENRNLYVNAIHLLELIDCMKARAKTPTEGLVYAEVEDVVMDLPWKEIKEDE